jgi:hypothetical protein
MLAIEENIRFAIKVKVYNFGTYQGNLRLGIIN